MPVGGIDGYFDDAALAKALLGGCQRDIPSTVLSSVDLRVESVCEEQECSQEKSDEMVQLECEVFLFHGTCICFVC